MEAIGERAVAQTFRDFADGDAIFEPGINPGCGVRRQDDPGFGFSIVPCRQLPRDGIGGMDLNGEEFVAIEKLDEPGEFHRSIFAEPFLPVRGPQLGNRLPGEGAVRDATIVEFVATEFPRFTKAAFRGERSLQNSSESLFPPRLRPQKGCECERLLDRVPHASWSPMFEEVQQVGVAPPISKVARSNLEGL